MREVYLMGLLIDPTVRELAGPHLKQNMLIDPAAKNLLELLMRVEGRPDLSTIMADLHLLSDSVEIVDYMKSIPNPMTSDDRTQAVKKLEQFIREKKLAAAYTKCVNEGIDEALPDLQEASHFELKLNQSSVLNTGLTAGQLLQARRDYKQPMWIVEGLFSRGGLSIVAGRPKSGKTTLCQNGSLSISRGETFLGRPTIKGRVLYFNLEEFYLPLADDFIKMGMTEDDDIIFYSGSLSPSGSRAFTEIRRNCELYNPQFVVIDSIFRGMSVDDVDKYGLIVKTLQPIMEYARETGTHFQCIHHTTKTGSGERAVLGSTAITATFDTICLYEGEEADRPRVFYTKQRDGEGFPKTYVHYDRATNTINLGCRLRDERQEEEDDRLEIIGNAMRDNPGIRKNGIFNSVRGIPGLAGKTTVFKLIERGVTEGLWFARDGLYYIVPTDEDVNCRVREVMSPDDENDSQNGPHGSNS
jgi:hypothetical protein